MKRKLYHGKTGNRLIALFCMLMLVLCCSFSVLSASFDFAIDEGVQLDVSIERRSINYFEFVPEKTGFYKFISISDADTYGYLYSSDKATLLAEDDDSGEESNFLVEFFLEKDKVYYWAMKFSSIADSGTVGFLVSYDRPADECAHVNVTEYEGKAPDCKNEGYTASSFCNDCQTMIVEAQVLPATNHPDAYEIGGSPASCIELGYTSGVYCDDCDEWIVPREEIDYTEHVFNLLRRDEPTCLATGLVTKICICLELEQETLPALGHNYELTTEIKATYTSEGKKIYTCTREGCNDSYTEITEPMLPLGEPGSLTVSYVSAEKIKIKWNRVEGAQCYIVSYKADGGQWKEQRTYNTYFVLTDTDSSRVYSFKVRAVTGTVEGVCGAVVSQKTCPAATAFTSVRPENDHISLKWNESKGAEGYQILISSTEDFLKYRKVIIVSGDITSTVIDELSSGTEYYIKIRSADFSENLYGAFSNVTKTVTTPKKVSWYKINAEENQITLTWTKQKKASGYQVDYSESSDFSEKKTVGIKADAGSRAVIKKLSPGKNYYFRVRAYVISQGKRVYGEYSETFRKSTKPSDVRWGGISRATSKITLSWNSVEGASGYQIVYSEKEDFSKRSSVLVSASALKKTISSLKSGQSYFFKIRAYKTENGSNLYGAFGSVKRITTLPGSTSFTRTTSREGKIILEWKAAEGADGYEISYSQSSSFKSFKRIFVKDTELLRKTFKTLESGKLWYFRIRSYTLVGTTRVYGSYSKTVSARAVPVTVTVTGINGSEGAIEIFWKKVQDCDGYEISYSTRSNFSDNKSLIVNGSEKTSLRISGLIKGQKYYARVRAFKNVGKGHVYGEYGKTVKTVTAPAAVNILSIVQKNSIVTVSWAKGENVSGYEIDYSFSSDFSAKSTIVAASGSATSRQIKNLPEGRTCYFRVRAYKTSDGNRYYGAYGKVSSFRVR